MDLIDFISGVENGHKLLFDVQKSVWIIHMGKH